MAHEDHHLWQIVGAVVTGAFSWLWYRMSQKLDKSHFDDAIGVIRADIREMRHENRADHEKIRAITREDIKDIHERIDELHPQA